MKKVQVSLLSLVLLSAAILACILSPAVVPSEGDDVVATQVAATLAALTQNAPTPFLPTDTLTPTNPPPPPLLRVAYVKDGNAWLWTEGLGALALTASGDVSSAYISDDGLLIAYLRSSGRFNQEIWAVNHDGSNARVLVSTADFWATYSGDAANPPKGIGPYQFGWRPRTHILYFNTGPLFDGPGVMGYNDLHFVNVDQLSDRGTIYPAGEGGEFFFSPDGARMALVRPTSISLANADGSNSHPNVLTFASAATYSEYLYYPKPVWAADSSSLRVAITPPDPFQTPPEGTSIWHIPADGSPPSLLTKVPSMPWPDALISPDLSRLAYAQPVGLPADNLYELHLANADGSADVAYLKAKLLSFLSWLPNSTQFVFVIHSSGADKGVYLGTVGGGFERLYADPTQVIKIAWIDDTHYLWIGNKADHRELRYETLGGGSVLLDTGQIWNFDFVK